MECNNTTNETLKYMLDDSHVMVCGSFAVAIYILASLGIAGNVITFIAIHTKGIKHSTNVLLKWICIIDSCTLLASALFYYLNNFASYKLYHNIYPVLLMVLLSLQVISAWSVVLLGYQRYRAVCYPFNVLGDYSSKKQKIKLLIVTLLSMMASIPSVINAICRLWFQFSIGYYSYVTLIYNGLLLFMAPALPLMYFMIRISYALKSNTPEQADTVRAQQENDNQSVTRLVRAIIVMFLISHSGHFIWSIMIIWDYYKPFGMNIWNTNRTVWCIMSVLICSNPSSNLFINYIFRESFRKTINEFTHWKKCC